MTADILVSTYKNLRPSPILTAFLFHFCAFLPFWYISSSYTNNYIMLFIELEDAHLL